MRDVQQAIKRLSASRPCVFPRAALQMLIDNQEEASPLLLDYLETVLADVQAALDSGQTDLMLYALFLLGQFRERRAYRPLMKLLQQLDEEQTEWLLGEVSTAGLDCIIASVCDGDIAPIKRLVENPNADIYLRYAAFYSLLTLACQKQLDPDSLKKYCQQMLEGQLVCDEGYLAMAPVAICEMLNFADLLGAIRKAYERWPDMQEFRRLPDIEKDIATVGSRKSERSFHEDFITDTIGTLENWACFAPEWVDKDEHCQTHRAVGADQMAPSSPSREPLHSAIQGTYVRATPKVGRNDPCPCGSGKKLKKCCGNVA